MASWMIHLRVADTLLDQIHDLCAEDFIMGNMAPDSGVPNEDWSQFTPSTAVSHFRTDNGTVKKKINVQAFISRYFTPELQAGFDPKSYSFFLGYLTHLLTDCLWSDRIAHPSMDKYIARNDLQALARIKAEWYDQDHLYLQNHPDFRAFQIYKNIDRFPNTYMDIFAPDAFDNRRAYIVAFYMRQQTNLHREYAYLTREDADRFVREACSAILKQLEVYCHG